MALRSRCSRRSFWSRVLDRPHHGAPAAGRAGGEPRRGAGLLHGPDPRRGPGAARRRRGRRPLGRGPRARAGRGAAVAAAYVASSLLFVVAAGLLDGMGRAVRTWLGAASFVRGLRRLYSGGGGGGGGGPGGGPEAVPAPAPARAARVVEDALHRAARVGLDGDEAEDVLGAQRGEGLAGVQSGVEPQARLRERFEEPVVIEPPCAARRDLRKHEVGVGRREPRREVWRLRHQLRPLRAVDAALDAVARLAAEVRVVPEDGLERLVRGVALGRREALVDSAPSGTVPAARQVIAEGSRQNCSHRWFPSFVMGQLASSDAMQTPTRYAPARQSYQVKNTQIKGSMLVCLWLSWCRKKNRHQTSLPVYCAT